MIRYDAMRYHDDTIRHNTTRHGTELSLSLLLFPPFPLTALYSLIPSSASRKGSASDLFFLSLADHHGVIQTPIGVFDSSTREVGMSYIPCLTLYLPACL